MPSTRKWRFVTRTRGLHGSRLAVALSAMCLAATSATPATSEEAEEAQGAREAKEVVDDSGSRGADQEFSVPTVSKVSTKTPSNRPKGTPPELDALLHLPSDFVAKEPHAVAGAGESEWRRRFTKADHNLSAARASLKKTTRELDKIAVGSSSSQWAIAPPGGGGDSSGAPSPLSFKLRQQLRGDRDRIVADEKALRQLRIEADLAGVPQRWRVVNPDSAEPDEN